MSILRFVGENDSLSCRSGDTLFEALSRHRVPPHSAVAFLDGDPVPLGHRIQSGTVYDVHVIEGYDYDAMRGLYGADGDGDGIYESRQLRMTPSSVSIDRESCGPAELTASVERRLLSTITDHSLIEPDESLLLAYSGGIDSTALLLALEAIRDDLPAFDLTTVTLGDYWVDEDTERRTDVLDTHDIENHVIPPEQIARTYNLDRSVTEVVAGIHRRDDGDVLSIANEFNRRMFEQFAAERDIDKICVGDHTSDILAGMISGLFEGSIRDVGNVPARSVGPLQYVYPAAYHSKRELYLYQYLRTGARTAADGFDPWELNKPYRHFYYYLADLVQSYCPGILHWLTRYGGSGGPADTELRRCRNCGKRYPAPDSAADGRCSTCERLDAFGYLDT